ncbi:hypothetical protein BDV26DRAFT_166297 [Aspergillus bertholletiae]|uniref:Permease for cytosine/purines, uracil, thiamine, allantoin-domain-containing protein n=1 Tax=Aspergillus bertholletiae TaxID=1226010 RepID=A0A5N7BCA3_9EURO|nr:hypothetical protein BDV26DRAFT_166297 [Aspergillus bertholletiae]
MADLEQGYDLKGQDKEVEHHVHTLELLSTDTDVKGSTFQRGIATFGRVFSQVCGVEARGIERVANDERQPPTSNTYTSIFLLWLSSALTGNNIIVGLYGPSLYGLDWNQAIICATLGVVLGSMCVGYMSTWGPKSGNRTLVVTRYFLGYYLSKSCCLLNICTMLGYGMVNCILGGQVIYTVSGGRTAVPVGIIVVSVLTWFIATLGVHLFQFYTRYAWIIQILTLAVMIGCAGPSFITSPSPSSNAHRATASDRLSFFSLCFASGITWAPASADYFVYFPPTTKSWRMFLAGTTGMSLAMILTTLLGIGLATGVESNPAWIEASLASPGSLLAASFSNLHGFGRFCAVILLLGAISNNIPCTYSAGLNLQMLGRYGPRIPRPLLTTLEVVIYTVCAIVAREHLREILENFLPLMSYWIVVWLAICLEEAWIFRRGCDFDWTVWNNSHRLPMGLAAGTSFLFGILGAVLGMSQSYFVGPIAKTLPQNCDLGMWLAFGFTAVLYPAFRYVELHIVGR